MSRSAIPRTDLLRLGVLTPSSNTVLEPVTMRLAAPLSGELSVHFSRFEVTRISDEPESTGQFSLTHMLESVRLLEDARVDAYLWSGTSGAWLGLAADEALVAAIIAQTGKPATTSTLALFEALRALGVRRYGLVVPYVASITDAIERNFAAAGFTCTASDRGGLTTNWDFATVSGEDIVQAARRVAAGRPEAIVVHCSNVRGGEVVEELEAELGLPLLDSVVVGLWGALRLLSIEAPETGFGALGRIARGRTAVMHA